MRFYMKAAAAFLISSVTPFATGQSDSYPEELTEKLILAQPGDIIEIPTGRFHFTSSLSLSVDNVILRGQGPDATVLDFSNQEIGAEGLFVTGNQIKLEGFTIANTKGDGVKAISSRDITIRNLKVIWEAGPQTSNGGYGLYPVKSESVLIENCEVTGASDAGIYVGQSNHVIVRSNVAYENVAGIEIENTNFADVYDNYVHSNTAGILVFNLPDLSQMGQNTRIFRNVLVNNNHVNFAPPINTVADTPQGIGLMLMAAKNIEVYENYFFQHDTSSLLMINYSITGRPITDLKFDPYVEGVIIRENQIHRSGRNPLGGSSSNSKEIINALRQIISLPFPDIIYDGVINPIYDTIEKLPEEKRICLTEDLNARFLNLDWSNEFRGMTYDKANHRCKLNLVKSLVPRGKIL